MSNLPQITLAAITDWKFLINVSEDWPVCELVSQWIVRLPS